MSAEQPPEQQGVPYALPDDERPAMKPVEEDAAFRLTVPFVLAFFAPFLLGLVFGGFGVWVLNRPSAKVGRETTQSTLPPVDRKPEGTPLAPANPVEVSTEVGSMASRFGKVDVTVEMKVMSKEAKIRVILSENQNFSYTRIEIAPETITKLTRVLDLILAQPATAISEQHGDITIATTEDGGKRFVRISQHQNGLLRLEWIQVDSENAKTLREVLAKSQGVERWMNGKAAELRK
jgi:hypothetical protein